MARIQKCIKDVLFIARHSEDLGKAKKRIEQLFVEAKAEHRGHLAVASRFEISLSGPITTWTSQEFLERLLSG